MVAWRSVVGWFTHFLTLSFLSLSLSFSRSLSLSLSLCLCVSLSLSFSLSLSRSLSQRSRHTHRFAGQHWGLEWLPPCSSIALLLLLLLCVRVTFHWVWSSFLQLWCSLWTRALVEDYAVEPECNRMLHQNGFIYWVEIYLSVRVTKTTNKSIQQKGMNISSKAMDNNAESVGRAVANESQGWHDRSAEMLWHHLVSSDMKFLLWKSESISLSLSLSLTLSLWFTLSLTLSPLTKAQPHNHKPNQYEFLGEGSK